LVVQVKSWARASATSISHTTNQTLEGQQHLAHEWKFLGYFRMKVPVPITPAPVAVIIEDVKPLFLPFGNFGNQGLLL
jgi:hypothetical protein